MYFDEFYIHISMNLQCMEGSNFSNLKKKSLKEPSI